MISLWPVFRLPSLLSLSIFLVILALPVRATEPRQWIEPERILEQAKTCLGQAGLSPDLIVVHQPGGTYVSEKELSWQCRLLPSGDRLARVRVQLHSQDHVLQSWTLVFREPSARACLYAARDLRAGTLLTEADLVLAAEPLGHHQVLCLSLDDALGRTLVANLSAGRAVPQRSLVFRPVFRRGDRVAVSLKDSGISLELTGTALGSGYPGREFRMKSASGKIITVYVDIEGRPFLPEGKGL